MSIYSTSVRESTALGISATESFLRTILERSFADFAIEPFSMRELERDPSEAYSSFSIRQRNVIIAIASIAGTISPLSSNLYAPAIPSIADKLNVSTSAINLTVTTYLIVQGISPMLWSAVGDSFGRRPLYLAALSIYVGACLGLSLSQSYTAVLILRALQAAGSSSTTAIGAGLIGDLVHVSKRGKYMSTYTALSGFSTAFGPVLGGVFAQYAGWHGIFFFLFGLAAILVFIIALTLPETMRAIVGDGSIRPSKYLRPPLPWLVASEGKMDGGLLRKPFTVDLFGALRLIAEPEVLCSVVFTGTYYAVWQMTAVATSTLYAERYELDELYIGLTYISNGVGSLCGSLANGPVLNWAYDRQLQQERRNSRKGAKVTEVEHIEHARLRPTIVPTVLYIACIVAFGWVIQGKVHLSVSIILAFFIGLFDTCILATFCKFHSSQVQIKNTR